MAQRKLGRASVSPVAFGCMNVCHAYGQKLDLPVAGRLFQAALDEGYDHFDTAAVYGGGVSESIIGEFLSNRRDEFHLASKCGIVWSGDTRGINNSPEEIRSSCDASLKRLNTDVIDLFYLHRWDRKTPIEDVVGVMAELVAAGKVKELGLSEVSAPIIKRAHATHPIAAVQTEYSLWTRNPEIAVLDACQEIGAAFVAFSPVARKYLSGDLRDVSTLVEGDLRKNMPRFEADNYAKNLALLDGYAEIARAEGCSMAELSIAWVLKKAPHVIALPGTTSMAHMAENHRAGAVEISDEAFDRLDKLINQNTVHGPRYTPAMQVQVDTEEF